MPLCTPLPRETANMEHENKNKQAIVTGVQRTCMWPEPNFAELDSNTIVAASMIVLKSHPPCNNEIQSLFVTINTYIHTYK